MVPRTLIKVLNWPDPLMQERLEEVGFFFDDEKGVWLRFCNVSDAKALTDWVRAQHLKVDAVPAEGRGELKKYARLSDELVLKNGGTPTSCGLCGKEGVPCRQWIEGDDTDSPEYPGAKRFYMCGECVRGRMQPHPRLYAAAEDAL